VFAVAGGAGVQVRALDVRRDSIEAAFLRIVGAAS
jgi:hypothetical protein